MACYTVEVLALALWIGGLVLIVAVVIPAVFNSFGMEPGGRFLSRVFEGYNRLVMLSTGMLMISAVLRTGMSRRPEMTGAAVSHVEWAVLAIMILVAALVIFILEPSSVRLQEQAFAIKEEAVRRTAYEAFFKSHHLVRALYVVNLGLAIAFVPIKLKHWLTSRKAVS